MIPDNIIKVKQEINMAVAKRVPSVGIGKDVKLIAVTKNNGIQAMQDAIDAGINAIGENRVQEALSKYSLIERKAEWHLIGHLQKNKVRQAVGLFDIIHSVDSESLAVEINRAAGRIDKIQDILIQVNVAGEESKFGISSEEVVPFAQKISSMEHLRLCGLMIIAPFFEEVEESRPIFREAYCHFLQLCDMQIPNSSIQWLSMGMTNDYQVAIEEGSNIVRIGTGIFGERRY